MAKSIEINYKSENGYEVLYPSTTPEQAGSLSIGGGEMQGDIILNGVTSNDMGAINKGYVDQKTGSGLWDSEWQSIGIINGFDNMVTIQPNIGRPIKEIAIKISIQGTNVTFSSSRGWSIGTSWNGNFICYIAINATGMRCDNDIEWVLYPVTITYPQNNMNGGGCTILTKFSTLELIQGGTIEAMQFTYEESTRQYQAMSLGVFNGSITNGTITFELFAR